MMETIIILLGAALGAALGLLIEENRSLRRRLRAGWACRPGQLGIGTIPRLPAAPPAAGALDDTVAGFIRRLRPSGSLIDFTLPTRQGDCQALAGTMNDITAAEGQTFLLRGATSADTLNTWPPAGGR